MSMFSELRSPLAIAKRREGEYCERPTIGFTDLLGRLHVLPPPH